jgi:hypothetical protein
VTIGGFIIGGHDVKTVVVRALGPTLTQFGVTGALQNPTLELHDGIGRLIASNDDWKESQQTEIESLGFAPVDSREAVIVAALPPGAYTAVMRGKNNATGVGLVDINDVEPTANSTITNISTRGFIGTDNNVMIGGVIVSAPSTASQKVVVRALGPSLTRFGVSDALQDPILELHNAQGATIAFNDNWKSSQQANIQALGFAPGDDRESAVLTNLVNGNYTAIVRGKNGTTGVGLIEVYSLP